MTNRTKSNITDALTSGAVSQSDKAAMLKLTQEATINGITHAFAVATWVTVVALVLALFIKKTSPQEDFLKTEEAEPAAPQSINTKKAQAAK
ncbi:hypothetical protein D3C75_1209390 [compost metagenome]